MATATRYFPVSVALSVSSVGTLPRKHELQILLFFGGTIAKTHSSIVLLFLDTYGRR